MGHVSYTEETSGLAPVCLVKQYYEAELSFTEFLVNVGNLENDFQSTSSNTHTTCYLNLLRTSKANPFVQNHIIPTHISLMPHRNYSYPAHPIPTGTSITCLEP